MQSIKEGQEQRLREAVEFVKGWRDAGAEVEAERHREMCKVL